MQRLITAGLTVLLVSFVAPGTQAQTRIERQLQLTHPSQTATTETTQPTTSAQNKANAGDDAVKPEAKSLSSQLSERDRLVQERQRQILIPVQ